MARGEDACRRFTSSARAASQRLLAATGTRQAIISRTNPPVPRPVTSAIRLRTRARVACEWRFLVLIVSDDMREARTKHVMLPEVPRMGSIHDVSRAITVVHEPPMNGPSKISQKCVCV